MSKGALFLTRKIGPYLAAISLLVPTLLIQPLTSRALTISPVTLEVTGDPGKTVGGEMTLENEQSDARTYVSTVREFDRGVNETGTPELIDSTADIAGWIKTTPSVDLAPKESKTVSFTINIPQNARPGGHFAALLWASKGAATKQDVSVEAQVGTLVFLTVSGNIVDKGEIMEAGTSSKTTIFSAQPVDMFYRFKNEGNDRVIPKGNVTIKNMFGGTKEVLDANANQSNALPGAIRRYDVSWNPSGYQDGVSFFSGLAHELQHFSIGPYTADVSVVFGKSNQTATASFGFFMFPWRTLLLIVLFVLIVVGFWIWWKRSMKPSHRR